MINLGAKGEQNGLLTAIPIQMMSVVSVFQ